MNTQILLISTALSAGLAGCQMMVPSAQTPFSNLDAGAQTAAMFYPAAVSDDDTQQWDVAIHPDHRSLYYSTDNPRRIVSQSWSQLGWSEPVPVVNMPEYAHGGVSIDPEGRYMYFSAARVGEARDLYRQDLSDPEGAPERLTQTPGYGEISATFDRSGFGFMWTDTNQDGNEGIGFYAVQTDEESLEIISDYSDLQVDDSSGENGPYLDPDGRFLLFANYGIEGDSGEDLYLSELRNGKPLPPVSLGESVNGPANEGNPFVTPDGKFLLFASDRNDTSTEAADYQIYVIPTATVSVLNAALSTREPASSLNITPRLEVRVTSEQIEEREGLDYLTGATTPFSGVVEDRYPNGTMKRRKHLMNGKTQGVWIEWYETGVPSFYSEWNDGMGHGTWIYFHKNGEIRERVYAQNDIWVGPSDGWSETGNLNYQALHRNGVRTSLYRDQSKTCSNC